MNPVRGLFCKVLYGLNSRMCVSVVAPLKLIVILRGKTDGILKESELIMVADSLGKCSFAMEDFFFLNWLLLIFHSNLKNKNLPKEYGDE